MKQEWGWIWKCIGISTAVPTLGVGKQRGLTEKRLTNRLQGRRVPVGPRLDRPRGLLLLQLAVQGEQRDPTVGVGDLCTNHQQRMLHLRAVPLLDLDGGGPARSLFRLPAVKAGADRGEQAPTSTLSRRQPVVSLNSRYHYSGCPHVLVPRPVVGSRIRGG